MSKNPWENLRSQLCNWKHETHLCNYKLWNGDWRGSDSRIVIYKLFMLRSRNSRGWGLRRMNVRITVWFWRMKWPMGKLECNSPHHTSLHAPLALLLPAQNIVIQYTCCPHTHKSKIFHRISLQYIHLFWPHVCMSKNRQCGVGSWGHHLNVSNGAL